MKIFVTGASGFIGRNLVKRLVEEGHRVIAAGRSPAKLKKLPAEAKTVRVYLEYKETISRVLKEEKPDIVYHLAALIESSSLENLRRVNVEGTRNVLEACLEEGIKRVIYLSSVAVVSGNPDIPITEDLPFKATNPYGQSKLEAEKIALEYRNKGLKIAALRPCMVYGEGEPHGLEYLTRLVKMRLLPVFGGGDNKIHLVSVENVVDVMVLCISKEAAYEGSYFIADKEILTIKEFLNFIAGLLGAKPPIVIPKGLTKVLVKLPFVGKKISFLLKDRVYSIRRLEEKLGYVPRVSTYDGLGKAVSYCIEQGHKVTKSQGHTC